MLVKKAIPSSTQYESRGKSMADILKEKAGKFLYAPKPERHLMDVIKKNQDPGPGTYAVPEAMDKSSQSSLRRS